MGNFGESMRNILGLTDHVRQGFERGERREERNNLRALMGDYYESPTPNGLAALARAGADPTQPAQYGQQLEDRHHAEVGKHAALLVSLPAEQQPGYYNATIRPYLQAQGLDAPDWSPELLPVARTLAEKLGASTEAPAGVREFDALTSSFTEEEKAEARRIWAGIKPRASSGLPFTPLEFVGPDGRTYTQAFDKRNGASGPPNAGAGGPQPDPVGGELSAFANEMIRRGVPVQTVDAWLESQAGGKFTDAPPPGSSPGASLPPGSTPGLGSGVEPQPPRTVPHRDTQSSNAYVSPTPGQVEYDKNYGSARGKAAGERDATTVQRQANIDLLTRGIDETLDTVDNAIKQVPGFGTTGLAGLALARVPGTKAYDLRQTILTVKANLGFDRLQAMRDASPTGGALGQVAVQELEYLQAAVSSLDQGQTDAQLLANLRKVRQHYEAWKRAIQQSARATGLRAPDAAPAQGKSVEWVHGPDGKLIRRER